MKTALIIPTRGRAKNLPNILKNVRETTSDYCIYFVIDADDTDTVNWFKNNPSDDLKTLVNEERVNRTPSNYNKAYRATVEPYVAILADDLRLHPGWLTDAIRKIGTRGVLAFGDRYSE